jgi:hypothetical protein
VTGALKVVSIGKKEHIWGINDKQEIWRWNFMSKIWDKMPGKIFCLFGSHGKALLYI